MGTLSQLRARVRPAGFSLRKDEHLLPPLILDQGKASLRQDNVVSKCLKNQVLILKNNPQMVWLADIHFKSISFQTFLNSASRSAYMLKCLNLFRFYVKNDISSRWKFICSPGFLHLLCTVPHHYSNPVSLNFQPFSFN